MQRKDDNQQDSSNTTSYVLFSKGGIFTSSPDGARNLTVKDISVDNTSEVHILAKGSGKVVASNINCTNGGNVTVASCLTDAEALAMLMRPRK